MATKETGVSSAEKAIKLLAIAVEKAAEKIGTASEIAIDKIGKAADVASGKLANDALRASDVVANNAAIALKTSNASGSNDHDLLLKLEAGLQFLNSTLIEVKRELKEDIKDIKDGTAQKIESNRQEIETLKNKVTGLLIDVKGLMENFPVASETIVVLRKIASNNQLLIKIGGAWLLIMSSIILFHVFGIKI